MEHAGAVIGMPFSWEGTAFFLEAIALGIFLYGRMRVSKRVHLISGVVVGLAGVLSGILVVAANAWMNSPAGFEWVNGKAINIDPVKAMFNEAWFQLFLILLILAGMGVFLAGIISGLNLFTKFLQSYFSIGCLIVTTLLIPLLLRNIKRRNSLMTRFIVEVQTASILAGWFAVQFPVMIFIEGVKHLTVWNTQAPDRTLVFLLYSLVVGIILILPAFAYLFKIFKFENTDKESDY